MKLPRWQQGRQGTGYRKLLLATGRRWDLYLIDYPPGSSVPVHADPVAGHRHWRANIVLMGDVHAFAGTSVFRVGRLIVFRPDIMPHAVAQVSRRRVVLSFGVAFRKGYGWRSVDP